MKLNLNEYCVNLEESYINVLFLFSTPNRLKAMEIALYKVSRAFHNCPAIATKLQVMTYKTEEQARAQKKQAAYLMQLAARTTPKGLHCLSMRLTTEYFTLDHEKRQLLQQSYNDPDLYHYVVFSDNVLACSVVVNSTISSSKVNASPLFSFFQHFVVHSFIRLNLIFGQML